MKERLRSTSTIFDQYYWVIKEHSHVELFGGISPLRARPARETLRGIYLDGLANAAEHEDRYGPLKDYYKGLLLPGERKCIEPMAARLDFRLDHPNLNSQLGFALSE